MGELGLMLLEWTKGLNVAGMDERAEVIRILLHFYIGSLMERHERKAKRLLPYQKLTGES